MNAELDTLDTYHDPDKLVHLSAWSGYLSWVIIIIAVIVFVFRLIFEIPQIIAQPPGLLDTITYIVSPFYSLAIGIFYFVVLQAISEGIHIWMDIHENTQEAQPNKSL
jgi:hypothetical protein